MFFPSATQDLRQALSSQTKDIRALQCAFDATFQRWIQVRAQSRVVRQIHKTVEYALEHIAGNLGGLP